MHLYILYRRAQNEKEQKSNVRIQLATYRKSDYRISEQSTNILGGNLSFGTLANLILECVSYKHTLSSLWRRK